MKFFLQLKAWRKRRQFTQSQAAILWDMPVRPPDWVARAVLEKISK